MSQDDREQEGYEKPWDWKPHQKDERPMAEYDAPWDQRAKNIEQNIVKAKSAKEIQSKFTSFLALHSSCFVKAHVAVRNNKKTEEVR